MVVVFAVNDGEHQRQRSANRGLRVATSMAAPLQGPRRVREHGVLVGAVGVIGGNWEGSQATPEFDRATVVCGVLRRSTFST